MANPALTVSQEEQWRVQSQVFQIYNLVFNLPPHALSVHFEIRRENHIEYLLKSLKHLGPSFTVLDANRPWICYWIIHSIALLEDCLDDELEISVVDFLTRCQDKDGGYGGGPGQLPHLATTYAAIMTLVTLGGEISLSSIDRQELYGFLLRMKDTSGGFRMHDGGELDVRACYTAISVASILNILDEKLIQGVGDYILSCQTYEGGISGEPGSEAHGGYTYCGLAAMVLINEANRLNLPALINWLVFRQGVEFGLQGRTNKLVDGCYSFWQGAAAAIIQRLDSTVNEQLGMPNDFKDNCSTDGELDSANSNSSGEEHHEATTSGVNETCQLSKEGKHTSLPTATKSIGYDFIRRPVGIRPLFNTMALQQYILLCTQEEAGFKDKPGKRSDYYHTCYVLSGLSLCQHSCVKHRDSPPLQKDVMGPYSNLLEPVHPLYNVVLDQYDEAREFFAGS